MAQTPEQQPKDNLFVRVWKWVVGTWSGRIVGVALLLGVLISLYWLPVVGFGDYQGKPDFDRAKTLWDWFDLLLVPAILAGGGLLFSSAERKNERAIATRRTEQERERADERAKLDREFADKRVDEERKRSDDILRQALVQDYLDRMSELLLDRDKNLAASASENLVREVARARTLTVLRGLGQDGARKGYIVQFLYETRLIKVKESIVELKDANLQKADLSVVVLNRASLREANLNRAYLFWADLSGADLSGADLSGAYLSLVDLSDADLSRASLNETDLTGAILNGANLCEADLTGAIVTSEQLASACSLEGAIMPDGSKYAGVPPTAGIPVVSSPDVSTPDSQDNATT